MIQGSGWFCQLSRQNALAVRDIVVLTAGGLNIWYHSLKMARELTEPAGQLGGRAARRGRAQALERHRELAAFGVEQGLDALPLLPSGSGRQDAPGATAGT